MPSAIHICAGNRLAIAGSRAMRETTRRGAGPSREDFGRRVDVSVVAARVTAEAHRECARSDAAFTRARPLAKIHRRSMSRAAPGAQSDIAREIEASASPGTALAVCSARADLAGACVEYARLSVLRIARLHDGVSIAVALLSYCQRPKQTPDPSSAADCSRRASMRDDCSRAAYSRASMWTRPSAAEPGDFLVAASARSARLAVRERRMILSAETR